MGTVRPSSITEASKISQEAHDGHNQKELDAGALFVLKSKGILLLTSNLAFLCSFSSSSVYS